MNDLLSRLQATKKGEGKLRAIVSFISSYRLFFVSALVLVIAISALVFIWNRIHTKARSYEVTIENPDASLTISSEAIFYDNLKSQGNIMQTTVVPEYADLTLSLVNVSGELGLAAKLRISLESNGYSVASVSSDMGRTDEKTKIIYNPEEEEIALSLSKRLGGAMLSADPTTPKKHLTIFVGTDQK
jgi:hypothetical protein